VIDAPDSVRITNPHEEHAMHISKVTPRLVNAGESKTFVFVKVETDDGLYGWGECFARADREQAIASHVNAMARYIVGRSPFNIKHLSQIMYLDYAGKRRGYDFTSALSGIEHALWDIIGKATNQPIYNLLGGPCRDKIRVYANGWASGRDAPEVAARRACEMVERGFTALKWDPFPNPWRTYISRNQEKQAIESVRAVREAVGDDVDLLIEVHRRLAPNHALRVAEAIEQYDPYWYEEPTHTENLDNVAAMRQRTRIPVVVGEDLYAKTEYRQCFEKQAADIINPDVACVGGILELKEIAAMAEPYDVAISPHGAGVMVALAATIQASAVMPNFIITDYYVPTEAIAQEIMRPAFVVKDSYIQLPTAPGLGIDLDEEAMARHGYRPLPARSFRMPDQENPY
jgi:galactonate dehydratase